MAASDDPVRNLAHDHSELNRQVLELSAIVAEHQALSPLVPALKDLREHMFLHFAREEEGLFPLVSEWIPELADQVLALVGAHDAVCGALARMIHAASAEAEVEPAAFQGLLARFQAAYGDHAKLEAELLRRADAALDAAQRAQLAELVRGL
ncbi:MAG TPA: hemerythrin domain-containing protein [Kofleriaceae bacterium]|nr:hemerythrin domain-containing protein [Kofleriaceae bacterium]